MSGTPNPGSDEAVKQGCLCPRMDNCRGQGYLGNPQMFWITQDCPLHGAGVRNAIPASEVRGRGENKT